MNENKNSYNTNLILCQIHRSFEVHETPYTEATLYNHLSLIDDNLVLCAMDGVWKGKSVYLQRLGIIKSWKHAHHVQEYKIQQISENEISVTLDYLYHIILPDNSVHNYTSTEVLKIVQAEKSPIITEIKTINQPIENSHLFESAYFKNRAYSLVRYWLYKIETAALLNEFFTPEFSVIINHKKHARTIEDGINDLLADVYSAKKCVLDIQRLTVKQLASGKIEIVANIISEADKSIIQHRWICNNDSEKAFMQVTQFEITDKWQLTSKLWQNESSSY